jgi:HD-GYP domain-containing protein (c-di-GMP phosphodiesterase class II)
VRTILEYVASELGYKKSDKTNVNDYLDKCAQKFIRRFGATDDIGELNPTIERALALFQEREYNKSLELLLAIDRTKLIDSDLQEVDFLMFSLRLKIDKVYSNTLNQLFINYLESTHERPYLAKRYYFEYIKFLEDIRDHKRPRLLIEQFENKYPVSILNNEEKTTLYYLKGRAEYARGEYLSSLEYLELAIQSLNPADLKMKANIFNTSVNTFTDNLFFEEAMYIAQKAQETRTMLNLPETFESISCIAGIETKRGNHQKAYEILKSMLNQDNLPKLTDIETNRLYNYLAKSAVFCEKYDEAETYLLEAEKAGDFKGFTKTTRLLMLFKRKEYSLMRELFVNNHMLPENHDDTKGFDKFALGWGYTYMAKAAFEEQKYRDGLLYLIDGMNWFISDLYYLEARIVSLYGLVYELPEKYLGVLTDTIRDKKVVELFDEYIAKHSVIREKFFYIYAPEYEPKEETNKLAELGAFLSEVDETNYQPEDLKNALEKYCFI